MIACHKTDWKFPRDLSQEGDMIKLLMANLNYNSSSYRAEWWLEEPSCTCHHWDGLLDQEKIQLWHRIQVIYTQEWLSSKIYKLKQEMMWLANEAHIVVRVQEPLPSNHRDSHQHCILPQFPPSHSISLFLTHILVAVEIQYAL